MLYKSAQEVFLNSINRLYSERYSRHKRNPFWSNEAIKPDSILMNDNDYLRLSNDSRLNMAQIVELLNTGSGMQMSGVYIHQEEHPQKVFERAMAAYTSLGAAVLCQSGYTANVGLMEFLNNDYMEDTPPFYFDMFAHMSFYKGVNSAQGEVIFFRHNNPDSLEKTIRKNGERPGVIVVDSIYSVQGTIAPLYDIQKISRKYGCILVVDESHSLGVFGPGGAGLCKEFQIEPDFITTSLAKNLIFPR